MALVASCNGYNVIDLGVRVDEFTIIEKAVESNAEAILLSGLISPSLTEMMKVCEELQRRKLNIPVIVGGAATSEIHTAVKIAPTYDGPVFYSPDAAANLKILSNLSNESVNQNKDRQKLLREKYLQSKLSKETGNVQTCMDAEMGARNRQKVVPPLSLNRIVFKNVKIEEVEKFIDWNLLLASLDMHRNYNVDKAELKNNEEDVLKDVKFLFERIKKEKLITLEGVAQIFESRSEEDNIVLVKQNGEEKIMPMLRGERGAEKGTCLTDFINSEKDYVVLFAVSAGKGLENLSDSFIEKNDFYSALLSKLICDRLAEAMAQWAHNYVAVKLWGLPKENEGIRIAIGYPAIPDHTIKRDVFKLLGVENDTSMRLTETAMISPSESVCGFILSSGKYFNVGKIGSEQLKSYASKRGVSVAELKASLPNNISEYENN